MTIRRMRSAVRVGFLTLSAVTALLAESTLERSFAQLRAQFDPGQLRLVNGASDPKVKRDPYSAMMDGEWRESRILHEPPLPDPDLAEIRRSLGLAPGLEKARSAIRRADSTPPTPADLAESEAVRLTPQIRDLAERLARSPERIFRYVRDNTEYSLYFGAKQNSLSVLLSRRGNNVDTATLLIALLRASGIPARYGQAQVRASAADVAAWVGARKIAALGAMTAVPLLATLRDVNVDFFHVWAEAYLNEQWLPLDASFKKLQYQPGVDVPIQPFDQDVFLATQRRELASDLYVNSVLAYVNRNLPGTGLSDVVYRGRLAATNGFVEQAYEIIQPMESRSHLDNLRHRMVVALIRPSDGRVLLEQDLSIPRVCLQSLTVTAPGSAPFRPQLRLDDDVIATSSETFAAGAALSFRVTVFYPGVTAADRAVTHTYTAGEVFAFGINIGQASEGVLQYRVDRLLASPGGLAADPLRTMREVIHLAALRYLHRVESEARRIYEPHHLDYLPTRLDSAATIAYVPGRPASDRPFFITPARVVIDAQGSLVGRNISRNTGTIPTADFIALIQALSPTLSGLEHEVWEEIVVSPTASTVKILQVAQDRNIPILRINSVNVNTEAARLPSLPQNVRDSILASARAGETVIIPSQLITYFRWRGFAYTKRLDTGAVSGWFVDDFNGGDTGGNVQEPGPVKSGGTGNPLPFNGGTTGDPVDVSNGNMFYQAEDLLIPASGLPLHVVRTYNSQVSEAGPFGPGWTHSYDVLLRPQGTALSYRNATGRVEVLTPAGAEWTGYRGLRAAREGPGWKMRYRQGLELRFDANGKLTSATDANGNRHTLSYNSQGNITTISESASRGIIFSYNEQNRITAVTDFAGRRATYSYNPAGDLVEAQDAAGGVTRYTYYSEAFNSHNMRSVTDPEGNTTSWVYYADDKVSEVTGPGGGKMKLFYLPFRNETIVVDERGNSRSYEYDSSGRIVRFTDPLGNVATRKFTPEGLVAEQTDLAGYTTRFSWDALGNLTGVADPLGNAIDASYDPVFSRITESRDANGNTTRYEYDARGNLIRAVDASGAERGYVRDSKGQTASFTDPEGGTWKFAYNEAGLPTERTDPNGRTARFEFDPARRTTAIVDPMDGRTKLEYDARDRLVRMTDPLGAETRLARDHAGRITGVTDANHQLRQLAYDQSGNLARITAADGGTTEYANAPPDCRCSSIAGTLVISKNARGAEWAYSHDARGFVSETRNAAGSSIRYRRDANGNLAEIAYDGGVVIRFTYDANNRLTGRIYPDETKDTFTYDAAGNLTAASNAHVTYDYVYDRNNRVVSAQDSRFPQPILYTYDKAGRRRRMVAPEGAATEWRYSPRGELAGILTSNGQPIEFTYDAAGRREKVVFANQTEANYTYDAAGQISTILYANAATQAELNRFAYQYDPAGNHTSMSDAAGMHSYSYDANYRLTGAAHPDHPVEQYAYDDAGNRVSSHREATYVYDGADRLMRSSSAEYSHDQRGNLITRRDGQSTWQFRYRYGNELEAVERTSGGARVSATYKYDPFGRRIEKASSDGTVQYLYDSGQVLQEYEASGRLLARYTYGPGIDEPMIMERDRNGNGSFDPDEVFFYQSDGLGSVRALTDGAGTVVERFDYDTFGNLASDSRPSKVGNPYLFTGREWDSEAGIYYYRARHYDPAIGRFLQPDTIWNLTRPETLNRYVYVANNPVTFVDPSGHETRLPIAGESRLITWVEDGEIQRLLVIEGSQPPEGVKLVTVMARPEQPQLVDPEYAVRTIYDPQEDMVYQLRPAFDTREEALAQAAKDDAFIRSLPPPKWYALPW